MAWTVAQLLAWIDEVEPRAATRSHFEWLDMPPTTSSEAIQNAYHAVARTRHPDVARNLLGPRDLDRLVRMYSRVTGAYAALRAPDAAAAYLRQRRASSAELTAPAAGRSAPPATASPAPPPLATAAAATGSPATAPLDPTRSMNARALTLYRRAEGALRLGDRTTAVLQIRMAIAADPKSELLRGALAELLAPKAR